MLIILRSTINIDEGNPHDHIMSTRTFTLTMNKTFIWTPKIVREVTTVHFIFANHLTLINLMLQILEVG
jgi:hypothetical protein